MNSTKEIKIAAGSGDSFSRLLLYHAYLYLKTAPPYTNPLIGPLYLLIRGRAMKKNLSLFHE
jgi:hypothetical protein